MERYDDLDVKQIALVGAVSSLIVVILVVATYTLYLNYTEWLEASKLAAEGVSEPQQVLNEQRDLISNYDKLDAETYAIPIDRAMQMTVEEMTAAGGDEGANKGI